METDTRKTGLTEGLERYLLAIDQLDRQTGDVRASAVASLVGVSRPAATQAMRSLTRLGMVRHEPYRSIVLTDHGRQSICGARMRRRTIDRFLSSVLGLDESSVGELGQVLARRNPAVVDRMQQLSELVERCPRIDTRWLARLSEVCDSVGADCSLCSES